MKIPFPSDTTIMQYAESDLASLTHYPFRFACGIQLLCVSGRSIISTGVEQYDFCETSELIFLAGSLIQVINPSPDFRVRMLLFPKEIFLKASLPIDTSYFNYITEVPYFNHAANDANLASWRRVNQWMDMTELLFTQSGKAFPRATGTKLSAKFVYVGIQQHSAKVSFHTQQVQPETNVVSPLYVLDT